MNDDRPYAIEMSPWEDVDGRAVVAFVSCENECVTLIYPFAFGPPRENPAFVQRLIVFGARAAWIAAHGCTP